MDDAGRRRVLVVEDEALLAMEIESIVEDAGCTVVGPAHGVAAALPLAGGETLDAALLDLNLGDGNGTEVARVLAERGVPFAFVTGYAPTHFDPAFAERPILRKPYRPPEVEALLRGLLGDG
jgi:CheY-like chemotaxis protein